MCIRRPDFAFAIVCLTFTVPSAGNPGEIIRTLSGIINDLGTTEFAPVFKEFRKRAGIYGLGDTQVRHLLAEMENKRDTVC